MRWIYDNLLKDFFTCLRLLQSSTDNFFSSDPFKPSGSGSDSKKTTDSKDLSSSAKDPFSNPFGSDPFGEFTTIFFSSLPFKATVEPKLTNISSKRTLPSDPVTCLLHSSQGLVGNTEQARSAREGWWEWAQIASWKQLFLISTVPAYRRLTAAVYMEGGRF